MANNFPFDLKALGGERRAFPDRLEPMLATKVRRVPEDEDYIFEVKWDGYRILAFKDRDVSLRSRKGQEFAEVYTTVRDSLRSLPFRCVLDGEVIMADVSGKPSFDDLQNVRTLGPSRLVYCIFDVLWVDGYSLLEVPLMERRKILDAIIPASSPHILLQRDLRTDGRALFEEMKELGLEGVVAKKRDSFYEPGERSANWLKVQTRMRQEFVIGGWTESASGRPFRSLMFGYFDDDGKLRYFGHSGGGYTDRTAASLIKRLKAIETKRSPFTGPVENETTPHWVRPILVGEFEFASLTKSGRIRKPAIFKGLRSDKDPNAVRLEVAAAHDASEPSLQSMISANSNWPEVKESLQRGSVNTLNVDGNNVKVNNIEQVLWRDGPVLKADLLTYYVDVADHILPYLRNRPLSLHIKHNGPQAPGLYIKGMEGNAPPWAQTANVRRKHRKEGKSEWIDYLVCNNAATLVYAVNLGCIDFNPWNATTANLSSPDQLIIDLDPSADDFTAVVKVAQVARKVLGKIGINAFPKTSGKTGIHIVIPVMPVFTYHQGRATVTALCNMIHEKTPSISTTEDSIARRGDKVFVDDNQNDEADTIAAVYSVRPSHAPTVSAPLKWSDITGSLRPTDYNIQNVRQLLSKKGDLFSGSRDEDVRRSNTRILEKHFGLQVRRKKN